MEQNPQRLSKECSEVNSIAKNHPLHFQLYPFQDIGLIYKAIIELELGALTGNATLTDFDRQVILPSQVLLFSKE